MGVFDTIKEAAGAMTGGTGQGKLFTAFLGLVNSPQMGGVQGLLKHFEQAGLGNVVQSWLGTGQNQPINGEQVTNALGLTNVEQVARQAGMSTPDAANGLAQLLPNVVDKLSPGGNLPQDTAGPLEGLKKMFGA